MLEELVKFLETSEIVAVTDSKDYGRVTLLVPRELVSKHVNVDALNRSKLIYTETLKIMIQALEDTKEEAKELRSLIDSLKESFRGL